MLELVKQGVEEKTGEPLFLFETKEFGDVDQFYAFGLSEYCSFCTERLFYNAPDHTIFCKNGCAMWEGDWEIEHNFGKEELERLKKIRDIVYGEINNVLSASK